jgi:16S rRNA (cytidine1402-2'-O)-methyltransferase
MKNKLFIVSTPIGNFDDITLRALKILKEVDIVVCEEFKPARRLLSYYGIAKELISVNEHNENESTFEVIAQIKSGKTVALISDAGTPLFSDPGNTLVEQAILSGIEIVPVPGASSLLSALVGTGYHFEQFYYYGWLSPKKEIRQVQLKKLKSINEVIVILETPYRLTALLTDIKKIFGNNQNIVVAYKLTQKEEKFYRGSVETVLNKISNDNLKGEFVLIIEKHFSENNNKLLHNRKI